MNIPCFVMDSQSPHSRDWRMRLLRLTPPPPFEQHNDDLVAMSIQSLLWLKLNTVHLMIARCRTLGVKKATENPTQKAPSRMFVLKLVNEIYGPTLEIYILVYLLIIRVYNVLENHSKRVMGTRIWAHFMVRGQDLTIMVIWIVKIPWELSNNNKWLTL